MTSSNLITKGFLRDVILMLKEISIGFNYEKGPKLMTLKEASIILGFSIFLKKDPFAQGL